MKSVTMLSQQSHVLKGHEYNFKPNFIHRLFEDKINAGCGQKDALIFNCSPEGLFKGIDEERRTTYATLNSNANKIASAILHSVAKNGTTPNQDNDYIIAVCMLPSDDLITTLLAIWKSGAAYLPLDTTFPLNRIEHILTESKPMLVIHDDDVSSKTFPNTHSINYNTLKMVANNFSNENILNENTFNKGRDDLAIVLYTSGSTGIPKGVRLPHYALMNRLQWQWRQFPYSNTETVGVFKTALTFLDSVGELWGPLLNEIAVLIIPKAITQDPERLVDTLEFYKIERLVLVPTLLRSLLMYLPLKKQQNLLRNLKLWVCSGETLSVTLAKEFYNYFKEGLHVLCNFYGSTEIMADVTYFVCQSKEQLESMSTVPIGCAVDNTIIYLLDEDHSPVKTGDTGEIYVSGLNLAKGYVNSRDPERFIDNPLSFDPKYSRLFKTGDFASIKEGVLYFVGRTDSQIKIRGHRVDLKEIEKNVLLIEGIERAIVLCYHADEMDQVLLAFVTTNNKSIFQNGLQIESVLNEQLTSYMIPQVIILETIPLLSNGKVDRQGLFKVYEKPNKSEIKIDYDLTDVPAHQIKAAKVLFETISKVIGRSKRCPIITLKSNFYELGGNSLNSIYTVTQLRDKGYYVGITEFISAVNLEELLNRICDSGSTPKELFSTDQMPGLGLKAVPLANEHKAFFIEILSSCFIKKGDIEKWLKPHILQSDFFDFAIEKGLSFIVTDSKFRCVGVALSFDAKEEPEVETRNKLLPMYTLLEFIERPLIKKLLESKKKIFHSSLMGTHSDLDGKENVAVIQFMETEVMKLAKEKQFSGIFATNSNPLTQQLGSSVYGYKTLLDFQINQYELDDGTRPFKKSPDSQRAIVQFLNFEVEAQ